MMQTVNGKNILISKDGEEVQEIVRAYGRIIWLASGVAGQSATIDSVLAVTLPAGSEATAENIGTNQNARFVFGIPEGNGISSIEKTGTTDNVDHYRIHYTNGGYFDYDVTNGGGGSGASVWGQITGTLSDQTDLQEALNAKADSADLGTMSSVNDAPSDDKTYGRKNGEWAEVTGGGGSSEWGQITGTLSDQTDLQDALDNKADVIVASASGSIVSIPDAKAAPVVGLAVGIEPVQSGSGDPSPDNVRPITGHTEAVVTRTGKNLLNHATSTEGYRTDNVGGITASANYSVSDYMMCRYNEELYLDHVIGSQSGYTIWMYDIDKNPLNYINIYGSSDVSGTKTINEQNARWMRISYPTAQKDAVQVSIGSTASAYEPYQGQQVTISLGQTVYGGTVDVKAGTMTVDRAILTSADIVTTPSNAGNGIWVISATDASLPSNSSTDFVDPKIVCNTAPTKSQTYLAAHSTEVGVAHFWSTRIGISTGGEATSLAAFTQWVSDNNIQIVYPLATPITVQLNPATLSMLYGNNTLWADTGDVSVDYKADTKLYIEALKAQLQALILQN